MGWGYYVDIFVDKPEQMAISFAFVFKKAVLGWAAGLVFLIQTFYDDLDDHWSNDDDK